MKKYTSHKDLELVSESAIESSLAGFWDWNIITNEEYLSPRFKEMFGYEDHEMENKPEAWQKIAYPEDLPGMFSSFEKHIESKGVIPFHSIVRYFHKNGETIWVKCNGKVVEWSENGAPARAIGCHIDITEEKELEIKLKKTISERDVLLREVHHRVKNNLQLILSLAYMKQKEGKVKYSEIEDSISSIAAAYEAIYKTDGFDNLKVSDYLNKVISPLIEGHKITLNLKSDPINKTIDFLIPIGLIISEFINNTIKYAYPKGEKDGIIDILINENDEHLNITYNDNGQGFSQSILDSIDTLNSHGISIIISLIKQLNGEILFSNDHGAKIEITIRSK